ncbi:MAG: ketol-acid reductoisomerase, partial [Gammaproteobacteria bacterium]|nr:ketol-acid reductoisomerase [Gammaproteobacteria bacterium]
AEYGCYLFNHAAYPLLQDFMKTVNTDVIGKGLDVKDNHVSNVELIKVNKAIRSTGIEAIGAKLRGYMSAMKPII